MSVPQPLHPSACPTCLRPYPLEAPQARPLTDREIDVLSAWFHYRNVKLAAVLIGVGEQRAKNLLARARARSGVRSNDELVTMHLGVIRPVAELISEGTGYEPTPRPPKNTTHGYASRSRRHPLYSAWVGIKQRVLNPTNPYYPRYGGRGIDMDPRWENFATFAAEVGEKPDEDQGRLSIDRIDNDRGYWPGNVRWATYSEQALNRRSHKSHTEEG